ncbi:bifunctional endoribonuclease/protein kinase ire1 [Podochytrium sp. JEL0797]|nr:bifunctional endoribonuclease/protein kinase ire1 [Podochytrium sp. JEL0797]
MHIREVRLRLLVGALLGLALGLMAEPRPGGPLGGLLLAPGSSRGQLRPVRAAPAPVIGGGPLLHDDTPEQRRLVVVATVDGALHGVHGRTGATLWTTSDPWGALATAQCADPEQDGVIIAEPVGDGKLYFYKKGQDMQKMHSSLKHFCDKSAFVDGEFVYSPKKVSRVLAIHPESGSILNTFGADEPWALQANLSQQDNVVPIFITRTEYMLVISDVSTKEMKWNITYGEYSPATIPDALFNLGPNPGPKDVSVGSTAPRLSMTANVDGVVILDDSRNDNEWELKFSSPALAAFSIDDPLVPSQGHQVRKFFHADSPTPAAASHLPRTNPFLHSTPRVAPKLDKVFVGQIGDSYYLLSQENSKIGGIEGANRGLIDAPVRNSIEGGKGVPPKKVTSSVTAAPIPSSTQQPAAAASSRVDESCPPDSPAFPSCLVGVHTVDPAKPSTAKQASSSATNGGSPPPPRGTASASRMPTSEEMHAFLSSTSTFRTLERVLGGGSGGLSNTVVYVLTGLVLLVVTAAAWWWCGVNAGGCVVWVEGVGVKVGELEGRYRGIVGRLNREAEGGEEEKGALLPEHVLAGGEKEEEKEVGCAVGCGVVNAFEVLERILAEAREGSGASGVEGEGGKRKGKKGKGVVVSKVHKAAAAAGAGKKKKKGTPVQVVQEKETSVEILSSEAGSEAGGEDDAELDLDNMDRLTMVTTTPVAQPSELLVPSLDPTNRNESDTTAVHSQNESASTPSITSITLPTEQSTLRTLTVSSHVLGHGSHGTMVFKGTFEGRPVAIKRLLLDFYDVAHHEVKILQDSDHHPNVIRYFYQEATERFMYIALELCPASLADVVENPMNAELHAIALTLKPQRVLFQIMAGIQHLHDLKLVHRDIKPQNILVSAGDGYRRGSGGKSGRHPRILITDFGLCKRLADDESSFHNTVHTTGGTVGWRAPECMMGSVGAGGVLRPVVADPEKEDGDWVSMSPGMQRMRITKSIDIFSAGCVFAYFLTGGVHPFGDKYTREMNILKGNHRLDRLDSVEGGVEAKDLVRRMILKDPKKRPDSQTILSHPYFWSATTKLAFLQEVSDRLEPEPRDPPSPILKQLERGAEKALGTKNWSTKLDRRILLDLRSHRQYDTATIQDLLRVIRNKKHHYREMGEDVKKVVGSMPEGFLGYFVGLFPGLLMHVYYVVEGGKGVKREDVFVEYFE